MSEFPAIEVTAAQAWFLAEHLQAGGYPWMLAITAPYSDPAERASFNKRCLQELQAMGLMDGQGRVHQALAHSVTTVGRATQWLEWYTTVTPERILRGVLARTGEPDAVCVLRFAQMVTFTPIQVSYTEALIPYLTAGLPDQPPARFNEFSLPMDLGVTIDHRVANGADIVDELIDAGVPEGAVHVIATARGGTFTNAEITAHESIHGVRRSTDVGVSLLGTDVGRILVSPPPGEPREGGESVWAPADPFAVAAALHHLTGRLSSGSWFPHDPFSN